MKGLKEMDFIQLWLGIKANVESSQTRECNDNTSRPKLSCAFCCGSPSLLKEENKDREEAFYAEHLIAQNMAKKYDPSVFPLKLWASEYYCQETRIFPLLFKHGIT